MRGGGSIAAEGVKLCPDVINSAIKVGHGFNETGNVPKIIYM